MQFICTNRIKVAPQGKIYEKKSRIDCSFFPMHICRDASFVWQSNHISVCRQTILSAKISVVCLVTHLYLNC